MSDHELKLLYQVLQTSEQGLLNVLPKIMERYYSSSAIHTTRDYIYVTGDIPVALVAHLDIVHPAPPRIIYKDPEAGVIWSPSGLGADDRAGVYSILHILEDGYRPSIIFTTGEERGGTGAVSLVTDFLVPETELYFLIELDRQGYNEAVYYDCGNQAFQNFITSFGFQTDFGTFSDIAIIGPEWDVAAVNLSIGYYDEHSKAERLYYDAMIETIKIVENILQSYGEIAFDYQEISYPNDLNYGWLPASANHMVQCDCCNYYYSDTMMTNVEDDEGYRWHLCPNCVAKHSDPCKECGTLMINLNHEKKDKICFICAMEEKYGAIGSTSRASRKCN